MVRLTRSSGRPPAAASAVSRLPRACSNCGTTPPAATFPSRSMPIWPARNTIRPAGAETACEKPEGRASSSGLIRSRVIAEAYRYRVSLTIVSFPAYDDAMRIAVLGGGPGGLYFAALAKQLDARHDITVWERNAADDTFGFGVVFSDETLGGIEHADREIFAAMRRRFAPVFAPDLERRRSKYIWLGTDLVFDAFKFYILDTPAGIMQVHGYPYSERASTFILEMHEDVWRRAGFGSVAAADLAPGQSDEASIEMIRGLCADVLGGPSGGQHSLFAN